MRVFSVPASVVSIHAPREGCDYFSVEKKEKVLVRFNSRTPGGVRLSVAERFSL